MSALKLSIAQVEKVAERVGATFGTAFLGSLLAGGVSWNLAVVDKAAVAGVAAAAVLVQSLLSAWLTGSAALLKRNR